jgi:hypothetical protein
MSQPIHPVVVARCEALKALHTRFAAEAQPDVALCRWLGIPNPDDCPVPGDARSWGKAEWGEWALKNGYAYDGERAHNFMWRHTVAPSLTIGLAKTSGDWRSPMRLATDVRRAVRTLAVNAARFLAMCLTPVHELTNALHDDHDLYDPAKDEEELKNCVINGASHPEVYEKLILAAADGFTLDSVNAFRAGKVPNQTVLAALNALDKEFGVPRRRALKMTGMSDSVADALVLRLQGNGMVPADVLYDLKDTLAQLRAEEAEAKARKQAERDAERAAKEAAKAPKPAPVVTRRDQIQTVLNQRRQMIIDQLHRVEQASKSAVDRVMLALHDIPSFDLPEDLNDPAQAKQIEQLTADLAAADVERTALKVRLEQVVPKTAIDSEQAAHAAELRAHLQAFAGLVVDTVRGAGQMNPFALVSALNSLAQEAEAAITFAKSTAPPTAPDEVTLTAESAA